MATTFDLEQTDLLLSTTRAVRKRLDLERDVPDDVLLECIGLSQQAPTGSNNQGWRWLVVRDPEKKKALADIYRTFGRDYLAAGAQSAEGQTQRVLSSALYLAENLEKVPVHVIPCVQGRMPDGTPAAMASGLYGSIYPAIWSFQLALRARGLGSCLTTLHLPGEKDAAEILGIPYDEVTQVALLPVAYTKGTDFKPAERRPPEHITSFDTWGNKHPT